MSSSFEKIKLTTKESNFKSKHMHALNLKSVSIQNSIDWLDRILRRIGNISVLKFVYFAYQNSYNYRMTLVHSPSANFQNLTVPSSDPLIQYCSLVDKIIQRILFRWPWGTIATSLVLPFLIVTPIWLKQDPYRRYHLRFIKWIQTTHLFIIYGVNRKPTLVR